MGLSLEIQEVWDHPTTAANNHMVLLYKSTALLPYPPKRTTKKGVITPILQMREPRLRGSRTSKANRASKGWKENRNHPPPMSPTPEPPGAPPSKDEKPLRADKGASSKRRGNGCRSHKSGTRTLLSAQFQPQFHGNMFAEHPLYPGIRCDPSPGMAPLLIFNGGAFCLPAARISQH